MNDLITRLHALDVTPTAVDRATVADDVRRGRTALRRQRARRLSLGSTGLVAAAVAGIVITQTGHDTVPDRDIAQSTPSSTAPTGLQLAAYTGKQLPGFVVTTVPRGFVLQGATPFSLDIARSGDTTSLDSFTDKVVVMLKSADDHTPLAGKAVDVNGAQAALRTDADGTKTLEFSDGTHTVQVQSWGTLGLTDAQVVSIAEGVTVTAEAQAGVG